MLYLHVYSAFYSVSVSVGLSVCLSLTIANMVFRYRYLVLDWFARGLTVTKQTNKTKQNNVLTNTYSIALVKKKKEKKKERKKGNKKSVRSSFLRAAANLLPSDCADLRNQSSKTVM